MLKYFAFHAPTPSVLFSLYLFIYFLVYDIYLFFLLFFYIFLLLNFLSVSHRICTEVMCLPAVTRAVVVPTPTMGGSAPDRAVLLSPMLRETATRLLWVSAFPRRNAILLLPYVHMSVSVIYACLPKPTMGGSAPDRAVLLSLMLKQTATSLTWA